MAQKKTQRGRKAVAIAAVTGVLGVGVYTTLASWTDNEWVVAGFDSDGDGTPDIGTSTFEVQQNRTQQAADAGAWQDRETNLEAGDLEFTTAVTLSPGTTLYAPVALRTVTDSLAGTVTLEAPEAWQGASATDPDGALWNALTYSVRTSSTATACDESTWGTFGTDVATDVPFTAPLTAPEQTLAADAGSVQYYCFAITLPEEPVLPPGAEVDVLQGRVVHPAWNFAATSLG